MKALYMRRCFDLAVLGSGKNIGNPRVGAIILQDDLVLAEGYHKGFGLAHGEVDAFENLKKNKRELDERAEIFVSLEPCNHIGKTPACTHLIERNRLSKITVGCLDPNTEMPGGGASYLRSKGCMVEVPLLEKEAQSIIAPFSTNQLQRRPYIILKWAESQDGFIAKNNERTKISGPVADRLVHRWRAHADAIMVGTNTVRIDNPKLTTRLYPGSNPIRIVLDRQLQLPSNLHLFNDDARTIVCTASPKSKSHIKETIILNFTENILIDLMPILLSKGISVLLVEGGANLIQSFLSSNLWDECRVIIGGKSIKSGVEAPRHAGVLKKQLDLRQDQVFQFVRPGSF